MKCVEQMDKLFHEFSLLFDFLDKHALAAL